MATTSTPEPAGLVRVSASARLLLLRTKAMAIRETAQTCKVSPAILVFHCDWYDPDALSRQTGYALAATASQQNSSVGRYCTAATRLQHKLAVARLSSLYQ